MRTLLQLYRSLKDGKRSARGAAFAQTMKVATSGTHLEPAYRAELLRLPTVSDVMREARTDVDPGMAFRAQRQLLRRVATVLGRDLERLYAGLGDVGPYSPDADSAGRRALRNVVLSLLTARGSDTDLKRLSKHYAGATNMTDQAYALGLLSNAATPMREKAFDHFFERWKGDDLVIDIWFAAQATSTRSDGLARVKALTAHPLFKVTTPNKVRALVGTFAANPVQFHRIDGSGYSFVAGQLLAVDQFNPQVAARLLSSFRSWRTLESVRRRAAEHALTGIAKTPKLSRDAREIVSKMLDA